MVCGHEFVRWKREGHVGSVHGSVWCNQFLIGVVKGVLSRSLRMLLRLGGDRDLREGPTAWYDERGRAR